MNALSNTLNRLKLRRELIIESKMDLEKDKTNIDTTHIQELFNDAKALIPSLQKTFEQTLEKIKYITEELPQVEAEIDFNENRLITLLATEKFLSNKLKKQAH